MAHAVYESSWGWLVDGSGRIVRAPDARCRYSGFGGRRRQEGAGFSLSYTGWRSFSVPALLEFASYLDNRGAGGGSKEPAPLKLGPRHKAFSCTCITFVGGILSRESAAACPR